jgi:hypothetical protein
MEGLRLATESNGAQREMSEVASCITAEERAEWLIDYLTLHRGEGRNHLLRRAVEQITAAEAEAYERGWNDAVSSGPAKG